MGKTVKKEECTCCHVHTTWRERPIPKHEVTIEMIASLNKQYRSIYNISIDINKRVDNMKLMMDNLILLTEETANLLLIIGSSKGGEATSEFGSETRRQYKKLLTVMEGRMNG